MKISDSKALNHKLPEYIKNVFMLCYKQKGNSQVEWVIHGRDRMVVGFTTTCAISAYHH